ATSEVAPDGTGVVAETTAPATDPAVMPTIDALRIESGYSTGLSSLGTRYNSAGALITNTATIAACGVKVDFAILDAAGVALDTKSEELHMIAPGAALALSTSGLGGGRPDEPASFTATIVGIDSFDAAGVCADSFTTSQGFGLETADVALDEEYLSGNVTNPSDDIAEKASIDCVLRDDAGAIVGGDSGSVRGTIAPRGDSDFKIRMLWTPPTATAAECTASA
ncbi:MAG: FxLYD domain-containing protein, partial [Ilumatobacteraceae bacterium]